MIAVDTNILLRYMVQDDPTQNEIATRFLENELTSARPGFVTVVALLELDWVLRSKFGFSTVVVIDTIRNLMASANLVFEQAAAIEHALDFEHGDLADNVLHHTALANGCTGTATFDKKFARIADVELLA